jgi:hypothetical protein
MSNQQHKWSTDNLLSAIAVTVATIGLVVSSCQNAYTHKEAQRFNRLSVRPHLDILKHQSDDRPSGTSVINSGIGPAVVSSFTVYLDGGPLPANFAWWQEVLSRVPEYKFAEYLITCGRLRVGQYVRPGEEVDLLKVDKASGEHIRNLVNRIGFAVQYKSVYEEPFEAERVQRGLVSE